MAYKKYDQQKLDTAITYVQRIADGCNPMTNKPITDDTIINNPNVIRCMFFIGEILKDVKSGGVVDYPTYPSKKINPDIKLLKESFVYESDKTLSALVIQINAPTKNRNMKGISRNDFFEYLLRENYWIAQIDPVSQKKEYIPTDKGIELGIKRQYVEYPANSYWTCIFNQKAQGFIVDNLNKIHLIH